MMDVTIEQEYSEIYYQIKNERLEAALQTIFKIALTSKAFKFDEEIHNRLLEMAINIVKEYDSFTNFKKIQIGLRTAEYLEINTLEGVFQLTIGIGAHEIGHIRFTNKGVWDAYCRVSRSKYGKLANTAKDILNIVEDRRIEYLISLLDERYKDAINFMSAKLVEKKEKLFSEWENEEELATREKIHQFMEGLIYVSQTFKLPEAKYFNEEVIEKLEATIPYLTYSYKGSSTKDAALVADKIMELISDWNEELNEDADEEEMENTQEDHKRSTGSYNPCEDDLIEELKEISETLTGEKEEDSEEEKEIREEIKKELEGEKTGSEESGEDATSDEESDEDGESSGDESNEDGESGEDGESSGDESGEGGESGEDGESSGDESGEGGEKSSSKSNADDESGEDGESSGDESGEGGEKSSGESDKSSDKEDKGDEKSTGKGEEDSSEDPTDVEGDESPTTKSELDMSDYLSKKAAEKADKMSESVSKSLSKPLTKEILDEFMSGGPKKYSKPSKTSLKEDARIAELIRRANTDEIHKGFYVEIKKSEDKKFDKKTYQEIAKKNRKLLEEAAREINKIKISYAKKKVRNKKKGRLDTRDLTKIATRTDTVYKDQIKVQDGILGLQVGILIDNSGSNYADVLNPETGRYISRYLVNQEIAITLHELCKAAGIPHFAWTFDEENRNTRIKDMINFGNCFDNDAGLNLSSIAAELNNRDGLAIQAAGQYLAEYKGIPDAKKLLIVVSDGQPYAISYSGAPALKDVKMQIQRLKNGFAEDEAKKVIKKNTSVKTVGVFSGDASENGYFGSMYENAIYANGDTIFQLPKTLAKMIVDEFGGKYK